MQVELSLYSRIRQSFIELLETALNQSDLTRYQNDIKNYKQHEQKDGGTTPVLPHLVNCTEQGQTIVAAVSGGSDSLALTLLLNQFVKEFGLKLLAVTVDHGLRNESRQEAIEVGIWLKKYGIEHHILTIPKGDITKNLQETAREKRYELLSDFCKLNQSKILATAHNLDDQAETVLMRLTRGSGVDGLSAIPNIRKSGDIYIIRPVLNIERLELQNYLSSIGQNFHSDPSNANTKFLRVKVRNYLNAQDEPSLLKMRLAQTANHMRQTRDYLNYIIKDRIKDVIKFEESAGFYIIKLDKFNLLHREEKFRSLVNILSYIGNKKVKPRFENLQGLLEIIEERNINDVDIDNGMNIRTRVQPPSCTGTDQHIAATLHNCQISSGQNKTNQNLLYIWREASSVAADINIISGQEFLWDNRYLAFNELDEKDITFGALTKSGWAQIKEAAPDLVKKINFPKALLYSIPVFKDKDSIIAAPTLGYFREPDLSHKIKVKAINMPY